MIGTARRAVAACGAALLAAGLSACGTFTDNDAAATVGDREVSRDEFEELLDGLVANAELTGISMDEETGSAPDGRAVLNVLVQQEVVRQFLAEHGEEITDADREGVTGAVPEGDPFFELPDDVSSVIVEQQARAAALARVPAPDAAELERRYREDPASLGVMCVRHILSETEADASAVRAELEEGADFAELAAGRSTDPSAESNGGAIQGQDGGACMSIAEASQRLDSAFVTGAMDAVPGVPTEPVETSFGWHVIEAVPYEDAAESLGAMFEQNAGQLLLTGYVRSVDVEVDPRYGWWDPALQTIQPLA